MDSLEPQIQQLTSNVDDLESALQPLLTSALTTTSATLPLLDKAKLHILTVYALESLLFTTLRLSGTDAKSHPVFTELKRVKEYFSKITTAEEMGAGGARGKGRLDKDAAGRFIKAGLSGNERYDRERREREERERAGAKRKLEAMGVGTHTRFDGAAKRIKAQEESVGVVRAEDLDDEDDDGESSFNEAADQSASKKQGKKRKQRVEGEDDAMAALEQSLADPTSVESSSPANGESKGGKKKKRKNKKK